MSHLESHAGMRPIFPEGDYAQGYIPPLLHARKVWMYKAVKAANSFIWGVQKSSNDDESAINLNNNNKRPL